MGLERHVKAVVVYPAVLLPEGLNLGGEGVASPLERAVQNGRALQTERIIVHLLGIAAPVDSDQILRAQKLVLHQPVKVNIVGIAREGREGGIGAVARTGGDKGQKLPVALARRLQKIDKIVGGLAHGADPVGGGQRAQRHEDAAAAVHTINSFL